MYKAITIGFAIILILLTIGSFIFFVVSESAGMFLLEAACLALLSVVGMIVAEG